LFWPSRAGSELFPSLTRPGLAGHSRSLGPLTGVVWAVTSGLLTQRGHIPCILASEKDLACSNRVQLRHEQWPAHARVCEHRSGPAWPLFRSPSPIPNVATAQISAASESCYAGLDADFGFSCWSTRGPCSKQSCACTTGEWCGRPSRGIASLTISFHSTSPTIDPFKRCPLFT
jgi:hypothetical protein